jgi:hypothetical protein
MSKPLRMAKKDSTHMAEINKFVEKVDGLSVCKTLFRKPPALEDFSSCHSVI